VALSLGRELPCDSSALRGSFGFTGMAAGTVTVVVTVFSPPATVVVSESPPQPAATASAATAKPIAKGVERRMGRVV
jgi:hypothetical protein